MKFDFDEIVDRRGTNSIKYDFAVEFGKPADVLPLWVADMDFRIPPAVIEALIKAAQHGIFGYSDTKQDYFEAVHNWYKKRFNWHTERSWLVKTPGVVFALSAAVRSLTDEGDAVMIQRPVYHPFSESVLANKRRLINNPLVYEKGYYHMDFDDFEEKIIKNRVKLFLLCNPHNPVGRVWTKEELGRLGDICLKHHVIVVSDEIHADFTYKGYEHSVFAGVKPEFLYHSVICTAPSKTFNLAGLQVSNIFIANEDIRRKFKEAIHRTGYGQINTMGLIACQAAYKHGAQWLDELKEYLAGNLEFVRAFLKERLPEVKLVEPQGTYLIWLDFRELGLDEEKLEDLLVNRAKLWFSSGTSFGSEGKGFRRVNIACPRSILRKAFEQLEKAIREPRINKTCT